jgi:hypothetical protein
MFGGKRGRLASCRTPSQCSVFKIVRRGHQNPHYSSNRKLGVVYRETECCKDGGRGWKSILTTTNENVTY